MGKQKVEYQSVFISDLHLASRACKDEKLLEFLNTFSTKNLFLVGDVFDIWSANRRHFWSKTQTEILRKVLKISEKSNVYFFPGNHDEVIRKYIKYGDGLERFGSITVIDRYIYHAIDGRNILLIHGDVFDISMKIPKIIFSIVDRIAELFSADKSEKVVRFINRITSTEMVARTYVEKNNVDAVLMGHTHIPVLTNEYINTGDWVLNCSYVVEHPNGEWELKYY